jgi:Zn-dependent protease
MISFPGAIPITIHPIFWIMAFGIGWMSSNDLILTLLWVVVITVSILVHEFGHALTAKAFGQQTQIELMGMGGLTRRRGGGKLSLFKEFLIVLNGPAAGFCLFLASTFALGLYGPHLSTTIIKMLQISVWVNFYWTLLNLLPVYSLDGGQLLRIVLESIMGLKGVKFALFLTIIFGVLATVAAIWAQQIFVGALFLLLTYEGYKAWYSTLDISDTDRQEDLKAELHAVENEIESGDLETAKLKLIGIRDKTQKGMIYLVATKYLAEVLNEQGRFDEAYELLASIEKHLTPDALALLQELSYRKGNFKKAVEIGNSLYREEPDYNTAIINAQAHALMGDVRQSVGWIQCATREGLPNPKVVLQHPAFDKVRSDPQFQELLSEL